MAITKIHSIKATVQKAVDYICNPEKTDNSILITSFGCTPASAKDDFRYALGNTKSSDSNKAFHLIQSFAPGEATYALAHKIGIELADRLLEGRHNYIITTHCDKGHIHNHIIFCAADNINYTKYHDCKKSYYRIRKLSDELCHEHGLSVIVPDNGHGKSYKQWDAETKASSWKLQLKADIDSAIAEAHSYEEFLVLMKSKNYIISGENFGEKEPKYIKFEIQGNGRTIRGSEKNFGKGYTKEEIRERIENGEKEQGASPVFKKKKLVTNYGNKHLINTSDEKIQNSLGLKHWAEKENLKIAAAAYAKSDSLSELEKRIAIQKSLAKTARSSLVSTQKELKELAEIIKYAEQYQHNRIYHIRYQKSKDAESYFRRHDTELTLYDGACNFLMQHGFNPKNLSIDELRKQYQKLTSQKSEFEATYKKAEKEVATLQKNQKVLTQYLGIPPKDTPQKDGQDRH